MCADALDEDLGPSEDQHVEIVMRCMDRSKAKLQRDLKKQNNAYNDGGFWSPPRFGEAHGTANGEANGSLSGHKRPAPPETAAAAAAEARGVRVG